MTRKILQLIVLSVFVAWSSVFGFAQIVAPAVQIVCDPLRGLQIALEVSEQAKFIEKELVQYKTEIEQITQRLDFLSNQQEFGKKKIETQEKTYKTWDAYLATFKNLRRRLSQNFDWGTFGLKDIDDILNSSMFRNSGNDPYQGLFTQGTGLTQVFSDVTYNSNVLQSDMYKNNEAFRKLYDEFQKEETRLLKDIEARKNTLSRVSQMQIQSEEALKRFQKNLTSLSTIQGSGNTADDKYTTMTQVMTFNIEQNLELARELMQQIMVKRMKVELQLLGNIRRIYLSKYGELCKQDIEGKNVKQDIDTVTKFLTEE